MNAEINSISIKDIFWVQFKSHLISFGFKGLPDNVHFTIGFHDKTSVIDLHVTKNVSNKSNKPKIRIVTIEKKVLEEDASNLFLILLRNMLNPINLKELQEKYDNDLGFISYDDLEENGVYSQAEEKFKERFRDISRIRKKSRLKIDSDLDTIGELLQSFAGAEEIQEALFNNLTALPTIFKRNVEGGMIVSNEKVIHVIRIGKNWFQVKADFKANDLLLMFTTPRLAKRLLWKTLRALVAVKNASSYSDTKHLNLPIRLVRRSK